jgi:hypothetical protein
VQPDAQLVAARTQLTFTPTNWSVPQVVSVQAVQDHTTEGVHNGSVTHTVSSTDINYTVIPVSTVMVTINDAVAPTIVVPASIWTKPDLPLTGTAAPGATVLLTSSNRTTGALTSVSVTADAQGQWSFTLVGLVDGVFDLDAEADGIKSTVQTVTIQLPAKLVDVTSSSRFTAYGLIFNRSLGKFAGEFVVSNMSSVSLAGPLQLRFDDLTAGVSLANATGSLAGVSYITLPAGLTPGQSVTVSLQFDNPDRVGISYTPKLFSGTF